MAFSSFTAGLFTAGQILTAAQMNTYIRDNIMAGGPIYATEAARDAAITSPFEGQRAYITGSTETTAAGAITAIPSGVQTIYNGTGWVTVTPTSGQTTTGGTTTSGGYTGTLTSGGTNPYAEVRTGTTALVSFFATATNSGVNTNYLTFSVSGATTINAGTGTIAQFQAQNTPPAGTGLIIGQTVVVTGLTHGVNRFTLAYAVGSGTGTFAYRIITVQGIA